MGNILMVYPALVTWLAVLLYLFLGYKVGGARTKYKVNPPLTDGPEAFGRVYRVQQNTTEQLLVFLPSMWLFAFYVSPVWAAVLGLFWVLARMVYAIGYYQASEKRLPGFLAGLLVVVVLLLGALYGMIKTMGAIH